MIKFSGSPVYQYPVLALFKGQNQNTNMNQYLFGESQHIFGRQNLASHLLEYTDRGELHDYLHSEEGRILVRNVRAFSKGSAIIFQVEVVPEQIEDVGIEFMGRGDGVFLDTILKDVFAHLIKRKYEPLYLLKNNLEHIPGLNEDVLVCNLKFSEQFVTSSSEEIQLPMFYLVPVLSGAFRRS
jgi:hypothetical protein